MDLIDVDEVKAKLDALMAASHSDSGRSVG
jgi:hypothetical protein